MRKIPLGLSVLFLLGLATPSSAIVMAQKDLPQPPCNCVWDFVNNPLDDPIQTLAEQEADKLHEGDPDWFLVCVPDLVPTGPVIVIYVPPNLPPVGVTPFTPPPTGVPFTVPPGGPETPPEGPPVQTAESATAALLLVGLLALRVRW